MMRSLFLVALGSVSLAACGTTGESSANRGLASVRVPVVEVHTMTYDLTPATASGFSPGQLREVAAWLDSIGVQYGDRVSVDQGAVANATLRREQLGAILRARGLMLSGQGPVTAPAIAPEATRLVVERASAHVPGCPNHSSVDDVTYANTAMSNFGCAVNSALARMVADPNDLVSGKTYEGADAERSVAAIRAAREAQTKARVSSTVGNVGDSE